MDFVAIARSRLATKQTFVCELQGTVAEGFAKIEYYTQTCALLLALGGDMCGRWARPLPRELVRLIFAYAMPTWSWYQYPRLTWTPNDPLFPHDPGHVNRDDLPWMIQISDHELFHRLWVLEHVLQCAEDELGPMRDDLRRRAGGLRRLADHLRLRTSLCECQLDV